MELADQRPGIHRLSALVGTAAGFEWLRQMNIVDQFRGDVMFCFILHQDSDYKHQQLKHAATLTATPVDNSDDCSAREQVNLDALSVVSSDDPAHQAASSDHSRSHPTTASHCNCSIRVSILDVRFTLTPGPVTIRVAFTSTVVAQPTSAALTANTPVPPSETRPSLHPTVRDKARNIGTIQRLIL